MKQDLTTCAPAQSAELVAGFDFDTLARMAAEHPAAFVALRRHIVRNHIQQAPPAQQPGLLHLQEQFDHFCALNPSPEARLSLLAMLQTEGLKQLGTALSSLQASLRELRASR